MYVIGHMGKMSKAISYFIFGILFLSLVPISMMNVYAVPGTGTLFGGDGFPGNLLTVNPATGATAIVGATGLQRLTSLAVDPTTGIMYAAIHPGGGNPDLFIVNPINGALTFVGNLGLGAGTSAPSLDFRSDGQLFASVNLGGPQTGGSDLATVNKNTGLATVLGAFGVAGMEGIAFALDGTLFGGTNNGAQGTGELYTINTSTGLASFVANILNAAGAPHPGGVGSLQFACDGTLFAGTARGSAIGFADLITINPITGQFSVVGQSLVGSSLAALAFSQVCQTPIGGTLVPIDTTALLLASVQSISMWMIPVVAAGIAIGVFVIFRRKLKVDNS